MFSRINNQPQRKTATNRSPHWKVSIFGRLFAEFRHESFLVWKIFARHFSRCQSVIWRVTPELTYESNVWQVNWRRNYSVFLIKERNVVVVYILWILTRFVLLFTTLRQASRSMILLNDLTWLSFDSISVWLFDCAAIWVIIIN